MTHINPLDSAIESVHAAVVAAKTSRRKALAPVIVAQPVAPAIESPKVADGVAPLASEALRGAAIAGATAKVKIESRDAAQMVGMGESAYVGSAAEAMRAGLLSLALDALKGVHIVRLTSKGQRVAHDTWGIGSVPELPADPAEQPAPKRSPAPPTQQATVQASKKTPAERAEEIATAAEKVSDEKAAIATNASFTAIAKELVKKAKADIAWDEKAARDGEPKATPLHKQLESGPVIICPPGEPGDFNSAPTNPEPSPGFAATWDRLHREAVALLSYQGNEVESVRDFARRVIGFVLERPFRDDPKPKSTKSIEGRVAIGSLPVGAHFSLPTGAECVKTAHTANWSVFKTQKDGKSIRMDRPHTAMVIPC